MEMERIFGYCRISRKEQNIERQIRNILAAYPGANIRQEAYTGTKVEGRKQFEKLLKEVQAGDTIVFDSVSRMSRNSEEGIQIYFKLFEMGVNLVFLKEGYINTDTYKQALGNQISMTGTDVDSILKGVNEYLVKLAKSQIRIAFDQAQKEVDDLHERTREGIVTRRRANEKAIAEGRPEDVKPLGRPTGHKEVNADGSQSKAYTTAENIKKSILDTWEKYPEMKDNDVFKIVGVSRRTYYKYKKELTAV